MMIRSERQEDREQIMHINRQAFQTEAEANLFDGLRESGASLISLVAEEEGEAVGHILFSPVALEGGSKNIPIAGLAPMAVLPEWQKRGVGTKLVEEGLRRCEEAEYAAVVVLGYPAYYSRFGFVPSSDYGIKSEYDVPEDVFMIKELKQGALSHCSGTVKYHELFSRL